MKSRRTALGTIALWSGILSVGVVVSLLEGLPNAADLTYLEGRVTATTWKGRRRPQFNFGVAGSRHTFHADPPHAPPSPLPELLAPGATVRIGHTDDTVGMFGLNNTLVVYSLAVNGREIYTFDEYRRQMATERAGTIVVGVAAGAGSILSLWVMKRTGRDRRV